MLTRAQARTLVDTCQTFYDSNWLTEPESAQLAAVLDVVRGQMKNLRGPSHPLWKGDRAKEEAKRTRAQRLYSLGACESCGKPAIERHHRDGNPGNNAPENVAIVCRRCHMAMDGRLDIVRANTAKQRLPKSQREAQP